MENSCTINHYQTKFLLGLSISKAFADDKIKVTENLNYVLRGIENIVEKGEHAGYKHILRFTQCFLRASFSGVVKSADCVVMGLYHLSAKSTFTRTSCSARGQVFLARERVFPAREQVFYLRNNLRTCIDRPALVHSIVETGLKKYRPGPNKGAGV